MWWFIIAGLSVVALLAVAVELLTVAGWSAAAATAATAEQVDPVTGEGSRCDAFDECVYDPLCPFYARCLAAEPYEGRHRAPDADAVTVQIERAAYWPPAADLIRPYATTGGTP